MKIKTRRYYIYYAARILFFLIKLIPRKVGLATADWLGQAAFFVLKKYREKALVNLNETLGSSYEENIQTAKGVFRHLAKTGLDWIKLTSLNKEALDSLVTETHGLEYLDKALSEKKGVILIASHFGNWELLSIYLYSNGYGGGIVVRRIYFHKYDEFIVKLRSRFGANVIYRDESPKKLLRILKDGDIVGILADQDVDNVEGVYVNFFDRPTYTPVAPVRLAMAAGSCLVPAFMIRKPDDTYMLAIEEPIKLVPSGNKEEDLTHYTQLWTSVLEKYIRKYPEQWVWMHPRWKTQSTETRVQRREVRV